MSKTVLALGKSTLARELGLECVGKPEYDFAVQADCDRCVEEHTADCVVITHGVLCDDLWQSMTVNFTSAAYLLDRYYTSMSKGQIILVGSASVNWQSWPGIDTERMYYSASKYALYNIAKQYNRLAEKPVSIQVFNTTRFASKMGGDFAVPASQAAQELQMLIDNPRITELSAKNQ